MLASVFSILILTQDKMIALCIIWIMFGIDCFASIVLFAKGSDDGHGGIKVISETVTQSSSGAGWPLILLSHSLGA